MSSPPRSSPRRRIPTVLVAADLRERAGGSMASARAVGLALEARLHVLHVAASAAEVDAASLRAHLLVEEAQDLVVPPRPEFAGSSPGCEVEILVGGTAADRIWMRARELDASVLVLAPHQYGFLESLFRRSVTAAELEDPPCPVLAVPDLPPAAVAFQRLLLVAARRGRSGSLELARRLAAPWGGRIRLLPRQAAGGSPAGAEPSAPAPFEVAPAGAAEDAAAVARQLEDFAPDLVLLELPPGQRGPGELGDIPLRNAPAPVLLLPGDEDTVTTVPGS